MPLANCLTNDRLEHDATGDIDKPDIQITPSAWALNCQTVADWIKSAAACLLVIRADHES